MLAKIPVYQERNHRATVEIFAETREGLFRRTAQQPFRFAESYIEGIGETLGHLVTGRYETVAHAWRSPTVRPQASRPMSFYRYLRDQLAAERVIVFTSSSPDGMVPRLGVHELRLRSGAPSSLIGRFKERYNDAVQLTTPADVAATMAVPDTAEEKAPRIRYIFDDEQGVLVPQVESLEELVSGRRMHINLAYDD